VALPGEKAAQEKLISILPDLKYLPAGVDGKPTIQFSGVNLQVIDGSGSESTINGTNVTGSPHAFTSVAGGTGNQAATNSATVSGGESNLASGFTSSVSGGKENKATGEAASIGGGGGGEASAPLTSVTGGRLGKAPYRASTALGGLGEVSEAEFGVAP
jgi:hypothetical protein